MYFLIFIAIVFIIYVIIKIYSRKSANRSTRSTTTSPTSTRTTYPPIRREKSSTYVHRPSTDVRSGSIINFTESNTINKELRNLDGLHDAFTGQALNISLGIFQCSNCKVYYHKESYDVILQENAGMCVSCRRTSIVSLSSAQATTSTGRDFDASVVTLDNFRKYTGKVITFEGYVPRINYSKTGAMAVMFQDTSWTLGLKLVVFRGKVNDVGGYSFLAGLKGKTIKVRGLLTNDITFGWEIIISQKSMILSIK